MPTPCSCEGSNENCHRCSGTGYLPIPFRQGPSKELLSFAAPSLSSEGDGPKQIANFKTQPRRSGSKPKYGEMASSNPGLSASQPSPLSVGSTARPVVSPSAKVSGGLKKARGSYGKAPKTLVSPAQLSAKSPFVPPRRLVSCPYCGQGVKETRINGHVSKVHPNGVVSMKPLKKKVQPIRTSSAPSKTRPIVSLGRPKLPNVPKGLSQTFLEPKRSADIERRLDGSKNFSQFRENGRFGSHPSFDDDE